MPKDARAYQRISTVIGLVAASCSSPGGAGRLSGDSHTGSDSASETPDGDVDSACQYDPQAKVCSDDAPCGGALIGAWNTLPCAPPPSVEVVVTVGGNTTVHSVVPDVDQPDVSQTGTLLLRDSGVFQFSFNMAGRVQFTRDSTSSSCPLSLEGPSYQESVGFDYQNLTCSWSGTTCECEAELTPIALNQTGTWAASGTSLVLGGTTFSFCATDKLTLSYEFGDQPEWTFYLRNLINEECTDAEGP